MKRQSSDERLAEELKNEKRPPAEPEESTSPPAELEAEKFVTQIVTGISATEQAQKEGWIVTAKKGSGPLAVYTLIKEK